MEALIDLNPAALPPRKRLKSLGSSASPPSTPTTPPPPRPSPPTTATVRTDPISSSGLKRKKPEPREEELFIFSHQHALPPRKAMFDMRSDLPSPSPSDSEPEQPRGRGRPGRKPGSSSKKRVRKDKEEEPLYCLCRQPYDEEVFMIACDVCNDWFHGECVGMTERKAQSLKIYVCPPCTQSRASGQRRRRSVVRKEDLDVEVNVDEDDDDEDEKENYHEYQQQRRKRAKGQMTSARGRVKGAIPGSTETSTAARRRSTGGGGIGQQGGRRNQMIEDDTAHVVAGETDSSKEDVLPRRVCVNKDCSNPAKPQSKYCSTECGVRVATQFLEKQKAAAAAAAEPIRSPSPKASPKPRDVSLHSSSEENLPNFSSIKRSLENSPDISAADDSDLKQLESLERQRGEVETNLRNLATKREEFAKAVQFSTTLFASAAAGDDSTRTGDQQNGGDKSSQEGVEVMDCFSCGQPIPGRNFGRHIEQCYARKEGLGASSSSTAPALLSAYQLDSRMLDDGTLITYCNHYDARSGGGYCAHPLESCPLHSYRKANDERRLCGCPTGDFESGYCERLRSDCIKHFNWENIRKMEMKLEKKRQTQLLGSLDAEIGLVKSRIRRRNQTKDDEHRTIEENGALYTRQHSPASK